MSGGLTVPFRSDRERAETERRCCLLSEQPSISTVGRHRPDAPAGESDDSEMFFFFSNRLGCAGSLLISAAITVGLLLLLGWI